MKELTASAFLDVRAPIEFAEGTLPGAVNIPILTDQERHQIGITYKNNGPEAALKLGHQLVSGPIKEERVQAWAKLAKQHPDLILFCFRGGQRSKIAQSWLKDAGIEVPRIEGGYKRVRRFFIETLGNPEFFKGVHSVTGHTGSGKTRVLRDLINTNSAAVIDLEKMANHRGSAFGHEATAQPAQAQFENDLALQLWRLRGRGRKIWMEDEARTIGKVTVPALAFETLRACPLVMIEEPLEARARLILEEYVLAAPWSELKDRYTKAVLDISRKLGGARTQETLRLMRLEDHAGWIRHLLENYYDPFYLRHMDRHRERVIFKGTREEVSKYIVTVSK